MSARGPQRERAGNFLPVRVRERLKVQREMLSRMLEGQLVVQKNGRIGNEGWSQRRMGRYAQFLREDVKESQDLIKAKLKRIDATLAQGTPPPVSGREKGEIDRRIRLQRDYLQKHMCPKRLFNVPRGHPDFERAVKACSREQTDEFHRTAQEYQNNILRVDPDATNIVESLRPKT